MRIGNKDINRIDICKVKEGNKREIISTINDDKIVINDGYIACLHDKKGVQIFNEEGNDDKS